MVDSFVMFANEFVDGILDAVAGFLRSVNAGIQSVIAAIASETRNKPRLLDRVKVFVPTKPLVSDGVPECCVCLDEIPEGGAYERTYLCDCSRAVLCVACFRTLYSGSTVKTAVSKRIAGGEIHEPLDINCVLCNVNVGARILPDDEEEEDTIVIVKEGQPPLVRNVSSACFDFKLKRVSREEERRQETPLLFF